MIDLNAKSNRFGWLAKTWLLFCLLIAATLGFAWNLPGAVAALRFVPDLDSSQCSIPISEVRLGQRVAGINPLREQAEKDEVEQASWRKISLRMTKMCGKDLWIDLLRPEEWIHAVGAKPGAIVLLDMPEMGAFGHARILEISPCPEIQPGPGTLVTGRFRHELDDKAEVLSVCVEGQVTPTTVTSGHLYWSADREDYVEAGDLVAGERLDTIVGSRKVASIASVEHTDFVYNLETTEHVYRVGSLGALVHNSCTVPKKANWTNQYYNVHRREVNALDHVWLRHGRGAGYSDVSRFSSEFSSKSKIKGLVSDALNRGTVVNKGLQGNTKAISIDVGRVIGQNQNGAPTSVIQVFLDLGNNVKTVFPL
ncbi:hypothetical protein M4951_04370 [Blastopirellula sp. J2-11]|uniref:hypothetical protein n=1 Tax=Blastopirellula sp. J2-11 TaxID=2943192 RepID=UPI0021C999C9|nr:hypothetical protein [Blastopirellula sp. J2-11]UUO07547.1 hypothetical protein M4951_04370 [Blastopirellula sp. J2-11]